VTVVAHTLQEAGMIKYSRGKIQILDVQGLEDASCECYAAVIRPPTNGDPHGPRRRRWPARQRPISGRSSFFAASTMESPCVPAEEALVTQQRRWVDILEDWTGPRRPARLTSVDGNWRYGQ